MSADPRLIAYVFDAMSDSEAKAFRGELDGDSALRLEADGLRAVRAQLERRFGREHLPGLSADQRYEIENGPQAKKMAGWSQARTRTGPEPRAETAAPPTNRLSTLLRLAITAAVALSVGLLLLRYFRTGR